MMDLVSQDYPESLSGNTDWKQEQQQVEACGSVHRVLRTNVNNKKSSDFGEYLVWQTRNIDVSTEISTIFK